MCYVENICYKLFDSKNSHDIKFFLTISTYDYKFAG